MALNQPFSSSLNLPVSLGELIAGKYRIERVLGEGGMGVVLKAHHSELDRHVAIKLLLPELARVGMAAERFRREARASARLRGEHVCQVIDVGTLDSGVPFMVMEYLEGHDLASELELRGKLPYAEAVSYVLQACDAVATAHADGVIHRDLKPANLFLEQRPDGSRRIKVLDFGVSKSLLDTHSGASALTQTSNLLGSPLYMSPEQLDSAKAVDERSDIWSLGVVLYELITGHPPFDGESIAQLVTAVLSATPRSLLELAPDVPLALQAVLMHALAKSRDERFRNLAELVHALTPFAAQGLSLQELSRMSARLPPVRASQPEAAGEDDPVDGEGEGALDGGHRGVPKRRGWLWLSLALVAAALSSIAQRWHAHVSPPSAAEVQPATLDAPALDSPPMAADAPPATTDALRTPAGAPAPARAVSVSAPAPQEPQTALSAASDPRVQPSHAETAPPRPARAPRPADTRSRTEPPTPLVAPISNFGGRR